MTIILPAPVAGYFAAKNRHDVDGMLAPFAAAAVVRDEGRAHEGRAAIRAWMEETTKKYRVTVVPEAAAEEGGRLVVTGLVSGDFPGSPARLTYRFALADGAIAGLEIG